jgi:hypothetical protein
MRTVPPVGTKENTGARGLVLRLDFTGASTRRPSSRGSWARSSAERAAARIPMEPPPRYFAGPPSVLVRCRMTSTATPKRSASAATGASAWRTSWSLYGLKRSSRKTASGSITSSRAHTRRIAASRVPRSLGIVGSSPGRNAMTRDRSAPAASRRGRIVLPSPSSALRITTPRGFRPDTSNGMARPVLTRAARSRDRRLFPSSGSPSVIVMVPIGMNRGQSHLTSSASTSLIRTPGPASW